MKSLISIVVPVYKVEQYLVRCIDSITKQSYTNIEILLVDDGSPDRCGEICDELGRIDSRIRVFHKVNGGLSDARNYGTERATGEFVAYIDSDDFVAENYIERMMQAQQTHSADVVCCDFVRTETDTASFSDSQTEDFAFDNQSACQALMGKYYMPLVIACCKVYKREIVMNNPFPVGKIHEDEITTCRFLYAAKKVVLCSDKLYAYYRNPNSITQDGVTSNYQAKLQAFVARAEYFDSVSNRLLSNQAWSLCVTFLVNEALMGKEKMKEAVIPFIQEHDLWARMNMKTYIKLIVAWLFPKMERRRLQHKQQGA